MNKLIINFLFIGTFINAQSDLSLKSNSEGLYINFGGFYNNWTSDYFNGLDEFFSDGYGFQAGIGYGFNQKMSFEGLFQTGLQKASNETTSTCKINRTTLGINYTFGATLNRIRPLIGIGYQFNSTSLTSIIDGNGFEGDYNLKGNAFVTRAGLKIYIKHNFGIAPTIMGTFGKYGSVQFGGIGVEERPDFKEYQALLNLFYHF
jgi:outer membrane protein W